MPAALNTAVSSAASGDIAIVPAPESAAVIAAVVIVAATAAAAACQSSIPSNSKPQAAQLKPAAMFGDTRQQNRPELFMQIHVSWKLRSSNSVAFVANLYDCLL